MDRKDLLKLLDNVQEAGDQTPENKENRILIIDGLNLFLRNFAVLNYINPQGTHVGGLGGFLRSLGSLVKQIQPTSSPLKATQPSVFESPKSKRRSQVELQSP